MLHAKSQDQLSFGSGEDFLPYMDVAAILVIWPGPFEQPIVPAS